MAIASDDKVDLVTLSKDLQPREKLLLRLVSVMRPKWRWFGPEVATRESVLEAHLREEEGERIPRVSFWQRDVVLPSGTSACLLVGHTLLERAPALKQWRTLFGSVTSRHLLQSACFKVAHTLAVRRHVAFCISTC